MILMRVLLTKMLTRRRSMVDYLFSFDSRFLSSMMSKYAVCFNLREINCHEA